RLAATLIPAKRSECSKKPPTSRSGAFRLRVWARPGEGHGYEELAAADASGTWRAYPQQLRRDVGGTGPDVGLRLPERRGGREDLQGREHALPVFALR